MGAQPSLLGPGPMRLAIVAVWVLMTTLVVAHDNQLPQHDFFSESTVSEDMFQDSSPLANEPETKLSQEPDPLAETLPTNAMAPFTAEFPDPAFHLTHAQKTKMQACLKKCKKDDKGLPVKECKWECYHDLFDQNLSEVPDPLAETLPTDEMDPFTAKLPDPAFHLTHAQKTKMQACLKKCKKDDKGLPVKECKWECYHDLFSSQTLSQ